MANSSMTDMLRYLAIEAGFRPARRCLVDYRFALALAAGALLVWAGHAWLPPFSARHVFDWQRLLMLIIWQPLIEEILFRGLIQGQLAKRAWGRRAWHRISAANGVTSLLFVGLHSISVPTLFSLAVLIPSLVFGYFRDRCSSVYPAIILHGAYNGFVFAGLVIAGNMRFP